MGTHTFQAGSYCFFEGWKIDAGAYRSVRDFERCQGITTLISRTLRPVDGPRTTQAVSLIGIIDPAHDRHAGDQQDRDRED